MIYCKVGAEWEGREPPKLEKGLKGEAEPENSLYGILSRNLGLNSAVLSKIKIWPAWLLVSSECTLITLFFV